MRKESSRVRDGGEESLLASCGTAQNLQYLPVGTGFIRGLVFTEEGALLLQEKLKSQFHLLITNKRHQRCSESSVRDARETPTVLSEPSTAPSSALRYLTFSTPFILYSSVAEGEEPPVNAVHPHPPPPHPGQSQPVLCLF